MQGSGWGWLGYNKAAGKLQIATCANQVSVILHITCPSHHHNVQDPLEATTGLVPLFGIDVWEHAYYLQVYHVKRVLVNSNILTPFCPQYKNVRPDYVKAIFEVANWNDVSAR